LKKLFFISIIFYSCAQVVPLTGGDKAVTPPKVVSSSPENKSVNFHEKMIVIKFDEFIQLKNLSQQLIISPVMDEVPKITVKGKELIIKIESDLEENTTYNFNFGQAIVDLHESNPLPNFKYVFSTGAILDSLTYSGKVADAFDLDPVEKVNVMLYKDLEDSIPLISQPYYLALTDKSGNYSLSNLAAGTYRVFALKDINYNYIFDLPQEKIAFKSSPVTIDSSSTNHMLHLFEQDTKIQFEISWSDQY